MILVFCILSILYTGFVAWLIYHWNKTDSEPKALLHEDLPSVCVVIVARNEEKNIEALLEALFDQHYPAHKLEIILFDDQSSDTTAEIISRKSQQSPFDLKLINLENKEMAYKKAAISQAVKLTRAELMLSTDADCVMGNNWVFSMATSLVANRWNLASGPVAFKKETSIFEQWQTIEFASLVGTGAATLHAGWPTMCNGANLMYRKSAFEEVMGYEGFMQHASGDDEFLMHKIATLSSSKLGFVKAKEALVSTNAQASITSFWHQRRRWSGKWKHYKVSYMPAMAIFVFLYHLTLLLSYAYLLMKPSVWPVVMGLVILKMFIEWFFLKNVLHFQGKRLSLVGFVFSALFYSFYAVIFGIASNFGTYSWKGRKINNGKYE